MARYDPPGLGWHRDLPDPRDFVPGDARVRAQLRLLRSSRTPRGGGQRVRPTQVDWRGYCPPIADPLPLDAGTAHACVSLVEYFERRAHGHTLEGSVLFVYQMTRRLGVRPGRPGAEAAGLRTTIKTLVRFGIPPEQHWAYDSSKIEADPPAFLFAYAPEYRTVSYVRLDGSAQANQTGRETLAIVKSFLAAGFPCIFGFPVFSSVSRDADIPAPTVFDRVRGGQAVVAVGYDDRRKIRSTKGAMLVRNSWGPGWGDEGYGWLPYTYIEDRLAVDFWTLLKAEWLESGEFHRPA